MEPQASEVDTRPHRKGSRSRIVAKLKNIEVHKLYTWIESHKTTVKATANAELAVIIAKETGLNVNHYHIATARQSLGISAFDERKRDSKLNLAEIEKKLFLIAEAIDDLAGRVGEDTAPSVVAVRLAFGKKPLGGV